MKLDVKLTKDSDWQEVEVVGFYDPERHQTVRLEGSTKKHKYYQIKMNDGRVYDKEKGGWVFTNPEAEDVVIDKVFKELPYKNGSIKSIVLDGVLERSDDVIATLQECNRVLARRGVLKSTLFLFPSTRSVGDPEYKNYFVEAYFRYFEEDNRYGLFSRVVTAVRGDVMEITLKK